MGHEKNRICRYWKADDLSNVKATFGKIVLCNDLEDRLHVYMLNSFRKSCWKELEYLYVGFSLLLFTGYYKK